MKYPKEWPGFRVLASGAHVEAGGIVEAVGIDDTAHCPVVRGFLPIRIVTGSRWSSSLYMKKCDKILGWPACQIGTSDVEPLTAAARAFIAEARAR